MTITVQTGTKCPKNCKPNPMFEYKTVFGPYFIFCPYCGTRLVRKTAKYVDGESVKNLPGPDA
jgi:hypothetical protein